MWCHDAPASRLCQYRRPGERTHLCVLLTGLISVLVLSLLGGCTSPVDHPLDPDRAGGGWIVSDPTALLGERPSSPQTPPPAPSDAVRHSWDDPITAWVQREMQISTMDRTDLPRATMGMAYLTTALHDALVVAAAAQADGYSVSGDALLAATAAPIILTLHPLQQTIVVEQATTATWVGVWRTEETPQAVATGQALGNRVAEQVLTRMAQDTRPALERGLAPIGVPDGVWTLRDDPPLLPTWGQMRPLGMTRLQPLIETVSAPPAWTDATFVADREAFAAIQRTVSDADRSLVHHWYATPTRVRDRWMQYALDQAATLPDASERAHHLARVSVAMHHALLVAWDRAFAYQVSRPHQWAVHALPDWTPLVDAPALPSYPASEVALGSAAATVLTAHAPADAAVFQADVADLARASVLSGQHWPLDVAPGQSLGSRAAQEVLR